MEPVFNTDFLMPSDNYAAVMESSVLPRLEELQKPVMVPGFESRPLYSVSYQAENAVGTVFLVHGFTENAYKYAELINSLLFSHFSVVAYDQRGHGRSWRDPGVSEPSVTHVDHFEEYVEDLRCVCGHYQSEMPGPWFLFAHSMGGAVAVLFLEKYLDLFSAAVLSSPMIAPDLGGVPPVIASAISRTACFFGRGRHHPFFMKPYSGPEDFETSCATDYHRFSWYDSVKASRPEFQNSVPSYRWALESVRVTPKILAPGAPERVRCPVLLFSAETDHSVRPEAQSQFISRVENGRLIPVHHSRHEIFRSTDDVLYPWWHEVLEFLQGAVKNAHGTGIEK